jgi:hypothetical protein
MAEWVGRVHRVGSKYRVVVEGLLTFETDKLDRIEERTAVAILARVRMAYPTRAVPRADPGAERVMELGVRECLSSHKRTGFIQEPPTLYPHPNHHVAGGVPHSGGRQCQ